MGSAVTKRRRRVWTGYTREPWPCCGKAAEWRYGRPKEGICDECGQLVERGRAAAARDAEPGNEHYLWTDARQFWPRYYGAYDFNDKPGERTDQLLANAMFELVAAVSLPTHEQEAPTSRPHVLDCRDTHTGYRSVAVVSMPPAVRDRLNALDAAIRTALAKVYASGQRRGRSAVLQLAAGELSLTDFNGRRA